MMYLAALLTEDATDDVASPQSTAAEVLISTIPTWVGLPLA